MAICGLHYGRAARRFYLAAQPVTRKHKSSSIYVASSIARASCDTHLSCVVRISSPSCGGPSWPRLRAAACGVRGQAARPRPPAPCTSRRRADRRVLRDAVRFRESRAPAPDAASRSTSSLLPALGPIVRPDPLFFLAGGPGQGAAQMASQVREIFRRCCATATSSSSISAAPGKSQPARLPRPTANSLRDVTESDDAFAGAAARVPRRLRRRRPALHHDDRDGRSGRRARAPRLRPDQPVWWLLRHAGRARLPAAARRPGPVDDPRRRRTDRHAPAALYGARRAARARQAARRLRGRRRLPRARTRTCQQRVRALLARLDAHPPAACASSTRAPACAEDVVVEARVVASMLFGALYSPLTASLLPVAARTRRAERLPARCSPWRLAPKTRPTT